MLFKIYLQDLVTVCYNHILMHFIILLSLSRLQGMFIKALPHIVPLLYINILNYILCAEIIINESLLKSKFYKDIFDILQT